LLSPFHRSPSSHKSKALADLGYEADMGTMGTSRRKNPGPCLQAWGVKEWERVSSTVRRAGARRRRAGGQ
jgi:hypothetical protein